MSFAEPQAKTTQKTSPSSTQTKKADSAPTLNTPYENIMHLQRTIGNRAVAGLIQAKLKISQPNDPYEQEADKAANAALRDDKIQPISLSSKTKDLGNDKLIGKKDAGQSPENRETSFEDTKAPVWAVPLKYRLNYDAKTQSFWDSSTNKSWAKSEIEGYRSDAKFQIGFYEKLISKLETKLKCLQQLSAPELSKKTGGAVYSEAVEEVEQKSIVPGSNEGGFTQAVNPYSEDFCNITITYTANPFLVFPYWQHERTHQKLCMTLSGGSKALPQKVKAAGDYANADVFIGSEVEAYKKTIEVIEQELKSFQDKEYEKEAGKAPVSTEETFSIHRKPTDGTDYSSDDSYLENQIQQASQSGQPLSKSISSFFGDLFGVNFEDVKIHNNSATAAVAKELNADAFTVGNDIYFDSSHYSPETAPGKKLLAHELAHVLQQSGGSVSRSLKNTSVQINEHVPYQSALQMKEETSKKEHPQKSSEKMKSQFNPPAGPSRELVGKIFFPFDVSTLDADDEKILNKVATDYALMSPKIHVLALELIGHADKRGGDTYNQDLGTKRAESVKAYLDLKMGKLSCYSSKPTSKGREGASELLMSFDRRVDIYSTFTTREVITFPESSQSGKTPKPSEFPKQHLPSGVEIDEGIGGEAAKTGAEAVAHAASEIGEVGAAGIASIAFSLWNMYEMIDLVNAAHHSPEKLAAIKAFSYTVVAVARDESVPDIPTRDGWSSIDKETRESWRDGCFETQSKLQHSLKLAKEYAEKPSQMYSSKEPYRQFHERMVASQKTEAYLKSISKMDPDKVLNIIYKKIALEAMHNASDEELSWSEKK